MRAVCGVTSIYVFICQVYIQTELYMQPHMYTHIHDCFAQVCAQYVGYKHTFLDIKGMQQERRYVCMHVCIAYVRMYVFI
jgi:hypothetical protein